MKDFFIADPHLGHANIIKYCRRPFMSDKEKDLLDMADRGLIRPNEVRISRESVEKMDQTIIDNINDCVEETDRLWLLGDFCFAPRDQLRQVASAYRKRINCRRINIVWGNHDNKKILYDVFNQQPYSGECCDHDLVVVESQKIFMDHYPARSWDCAHHGAWMLYGRTGPVDGEGQEDNTPAWMLYGHVHNLFYDEDEGRLPKFHRQTLLEKFTSILSNGIYENGVQPNSVANELLDAVAEELYGTNLTLDVGVDREHRFAPWSIDDIRAYMFKKMPKWLARHDKLRDAVPASTLKEPGGDPKF